MPKTERYSASAWVRPFSFSKSNRGELQSKAGLSAECITRIERAIENERGAADALSGEPSAAQVRAALQEGADAASNLSKWLTQVDAKTKSDIDLSNIQRTGKTLSAYKPAIRELILSIEITKQKMPEIKSGRPPAKAIPKFLVRVASIIADEIELEGLSPIVADQATGTTCVSSKPTAIWRGRARGGSEASDRAKGPRAFDHLMHRDALTNRARNIE